MIKPKPLPIDRQRLKRNQRMPKQRIKPLSPLQTAIIQKAPNGKAQ